MKTHKLAPVRIARDRTELAVIALRGANLASIEFRRLPLGEGDEPGAPVLEVCCELQLIEDGIWHQLARIAPAATYGSGGTFLIAPCHYECPSNLRPGEAFLFVLRIPPSNALRLSARSTAAGDSRCSAVVVLAGGKG